MPNLIKKYLCVICGKREIVESMTEHMLEGDVPDVSNCDFSTYSGHKISGGKLLASRPALDWTRLHFSKPENEPLSKVPGGICGKCLITDGTVHILSMGGNINFVDEKNLKNSISGYNSRFYLQKFLFCVNILKLWQYQGII